MSPVLDPDRADAAGTPAPEPCRSHCSLPSCADSVLADGSLINKSGTLMLAATARCFDVPFYACCDGFKLRAAHMPDLVLEEMDAAELGAPGWPGIDIANCYFDLTPPRLISAIITENGPLTFPGYRQPG